MRKKIKVGFFGTYNKNYSRNSILIEGLKRNNIQFVEIHSPIPITRLESPDDLSFLNTLKRLGNNLSASFKLIFQANKVKDCDLIIVLYPGHLILPLAKIICLIFRKKLVFDSFMSLYESLIVDRNINEQSSIKDFLLKSAESILLKLPELILVDTAMMTDFLYKNLGVSKDKVVVTPLGANNHLYQPSRAVNNRKIKTVTFFGTYNPLQGAIHIVKAAKMLKRNKDLQFLMIGDGYLKQEVVNFVKLHNLNNVKFIRSVKEENLVKYINKSDVMLGIFAKTIYSDRVIPNKIFAALACKKPLITAKLKTLKKEFNNKEHLIFSEPENAKDLAEKIRELINNEELKKNIASAGYKYYLEKFTPQIITKNLIADLNI